MTVYVPDWNVVAGPEQTEILPDGSIRREAALAPAQARKAAARLLAAAGKAEHEPPTPRTEESS